MKKNVIALIVVFILSIAGAAFAAGSPFADVPAGHWAYDALKQLSDAGIVEGYKDGAYRGQSTISRFEMAIIAGNAMTKVDKANASQKELIQKLAVEFDPEIKALGNLASATPKAPAANKSDLRITGEMRSSFESTTRTAGNNEFYTRLRLNMYKPMTDDLAFYNRVEYINAAGTTSEANLTRSFLAGKAFGLNTFLVGRMPLTLGQGLLLDTENNINLLKVGADGIVLGGGNKVKVIGFISKFGYSDTAMLPGIPFPMLGRSLVRGCNVSYTVNDQLTLSATQVGDADGIMSKSKSVGFNYKASPEITVTGEYGENKSRIARLFNPNGSAEGGFIKAKYRGADYRKKNSFGAWVSYRNIDPGFQAMQVGSVGRTESPYLFQTGIGRYRVNPVNDVKGFEFGFEQTLFKDAMFTLQYLDCDAKIGGLSVKSFRGTLSYLF